MEYGVCVVNDRGDCNWLGFDNDMIGEPMTDQFVLCSEPADATRFDYQGAINHKKIAFDLANDIYRMRVLKVSIQIISY